MKFGRTIKDKLYDEWKDYYMDYSGLKKSLKKTPPEQWLDAEEAAFQNEISYQLSKVAKFQDEKANELKARILKAEQQVRRLTVEQDEEEEAERAAEEGNRSSTSDLLDVERGADYDSEDDDSDDGQSVGAIEEQFRQMEEDVATLVADVHDLALFTKLNYTGFIKIAKKHDKQTGRNLSKDLSTSFLAKQPFHRVNYDALIVKLSKLYDLVRTRGHPVEGDSSAGGSQNAFTRQTTKYWVHPDNIVHLKLAVLKHLPVLVFDAEKEFEVSDTAITSIYFDNEDLDLYLGRLEKTEGAEAVRMRWYGGMKNKDIFVERKTHREDWTGEKSVKERFMIKEHELNDYLHGKMTMDAQLDAKAKAKGKNMDNVKRLAAEIQYGVQKRNLRPVMRSFYNRTAFQLPGDARVRISLDTELTMVREDNFDGNDRTNGNWRRTDVGIDWPFDQLANTEKELFPYAVLEVKLQTQLGQEPPQWVRDLVDSHLVEAVPKFSKFIHGCATLLPERVSLVPFWLPQMDIDIRKESKYGKVKIERPVNSNNHSRHGSSTGTQSAGTSSPKGLDAPSYTEPISDAEDDDDENMYTQITLRTEQLNLPPSAEAEAEAAQNYRMNNTQAQAVPAAISNQKYATKDEDLKIDPLAPAHRFDSLVAKLKSSKLFASKHEEEEEADTFVPPESSMVRVTAPDGKRIAMPIRIEPKVIFANERTFLKWLNLSVFLATIATGLLNFVPVSDSRGIWSAFLFSFCALIAILYSAVMFYRRAMGLRERRDVGYHDKVGPTILGGVITFTIFANFFIHLGTI